MTKEQIAREAADEIALLEDTFDFSSRARKIILAAIEKATEAKEDARCLLW
jgi:hypothetical protein